MGRPNNREIKMVRVPNENNISNLKLNVYLKNGETYFDKDSTDKPFGDSGEMVCFWEDKNIIVIIPMAEVSKVEMVFKEDKNG